MHSRIDRSNYQPNQTKTSENPKLDIGWCEGLLHDGRPYRAEAWCVDGYTGLTFFIPRSEGETLERAEAADLVEREGLVSYINQERRFAFVQPYTDARGAPVWSINVTVAVDDDYIAEDGVELLPYPPETDGSEPNGKPTDAPTSRTGAAVIPSHDDDGEPIGRYGQRFLRSLLENQPDIFEALQRSGELAETAVAIDDHAQGVFETTFAALRRQHPVDHLPFLERAAALDGFRAQAEELAMEDVAVPDEETERALREGGYSD